MLAVQLGAGLAVLERTLDLAAMPTPVMLHDGARRRADCEPMINQSPREIDIRAVGEAFVETSDDPKCRTAKRQVDRWRLGEVSRVHHPLDLELIMGVGARGGDREAGNDRLTGVKRREQLIQPARARAAPRVDVDDRLPPACLHAPVALVRDRDPHLRRRDEVDPGDRRVRTADLVQPSRGRIDNDDLTHFGMRLALDGDGVERHAELGLVLADDDDRDHGR
jgi:hypothetical protein